VVGFQYRTDAERFLQEFRERLAKFGLELHADKTCLAPDFLDSELSVFMQRLRAQGVTGAPGLA